MAKRSETFWDKRSQKYDERVSKHDDQYDRTMERCRALLKPSDMVLDVGCASGEFSLDLAPHVLGMVGIDLSSKMIDLAKRKSRDRRIANARFDRLDALDPSLQEGSFNAVLAFNVLHLVDDPAAVLARIHDLLTPGGLLISQTPCLGDWNVFLRLLIRLACKVGWAPPIRSLTIPEVETLVSERFEIVESRIQDEKNKVHWVVARRSSARPSRHGPPAHGLRSIPSLSAPQLPANGSKARLR